MTVSTLILRVRDLGAAREFYERTLGLRVQTSFPGFVFYHAGPVALALNQPEQSVPSVTSGLTEVVFDVPDIHVAHAALAARGVKFLMEPRAVSSDGVSELWAAPFRDPDGHLLSIIQRKARR
jgi:catechol 2,3-dioxygenase-like lactoylglutathione lyase family enzyme